MSALAAARVGEKTPVVVRARDAEGNWALRGGDEFRAVLADASGDEVEVALDDHGDGYYHGLVAPRLMGEHTLYVSLDDVDVQGSPHTFVARSGRANSGTSTARAPFLFPSGAPPPADDAPPVEPLRMGEAGHIELLSLDGHGNPTAATAGEWMVLVEPTRRRQRRRLAAGEARGRGARPRGTRRPAHRDAAGAGGGGAHVRRSAPG